MVGTTKKSTETTPESRVSGVRHGCEELPGGVGEAHLPDQIANRRSYRRATLAAPTLPCPIDAKSLAMPGDNGLWFEMEQCRSPGVPQP